MHISHHHTADHVCILVIAHHHTTDRVRMSVIITHRIVYAYDLSAHVGPHFSHYHISVTRYILVTIAYHRVPHTREARWNILLHIRSGLAY